MLQSLTQAAVHDAGRIRHHPQQGLVLAARLPVRRCGVVHPLTATLGPVE